MARFPWSAIARKAGLLVLRVRRGRLELVGETPSWFRRMFPEVEAGDGDAFDVEERFAFPRPFLPDARSLWDAGEPGVLRSKPWVENDVALEARAVVAGRERVLVVDSVAGSPERDAWAVFFRAG